jgi:AcrR family transcriptional regulator
VATDVEVAEVVPRPRVEGDREAAILEAALEVLVDVGYDRLTMDAVAQRARASKATLYRRWNSKLRLVIDALLLHKAAPPAPDTGSLRGDLLALFAHVGGLGDAGSVRFMASVITAAARDEEFAAAFRDEVMSTKIAVAHQVWARAAERGELRADCDVALLAPALPGIVLHSVMFLGITPDAAFVERVVDHVILPAALAPTTPSSQEKP